MAYVDCFVAPVPASRRDDFLAYSKTAAPIFKELGALSLQDGWADDVPVGERTSFPRAVECAEDEVVAVTWIVWPSKDVRDAAMPKLMGDPRMKDLAMPFDGTRALVGGFERILDA